MSLTAEWFGVVSAIGIAILGFMFRLSMGVARIEERMKSMDGRLERLERRPLNRKHADEQE